MLLLDKTLLKLSKGLWGWICAIAGVRMLSLIFMTQFAKVMGSYLGSMIRPVYDPDLLKQAMMQCLWIALAGLASKLLQGELEYRCSAAARVSMRSQIFGKVLELDAGNIEKIGPVSAITAGVDAVEHMQVYASVYLPSLLYSCIAPVYLFFQVREYSLHTALLLLIISVILLPLHNVFRFRIETLRKKYWHSVDDMTGYYLDSIRGISTLKLFDREKEHSEILGMKAEQLNQDINSFMKINFTSFLVTEALIAGASAGAVGIVLQENAGLGNSLTILMLSWGYFSAERELMSATHNALTAVSAAGKVSEILATDTSRPFDASAPGDPFESEGIRMQGVSFAYDERKEVLKDTDLMVRKGSMVALVGLSGSGKSTIGSLLMKFIDPKTGSIWIDGKNYLALTPMEVRKEITMVPQSVAVFSGTIRANLLLAKPDAKDKELKEVLQEVRLGEFADQLDRSCGDNGSMLSGGQKQKIGIARALLSKAPYIILDEATSSVDPQSEKEIWETIGKLAQSRTLIIISHRLASIRKAEQIYVLQEGKITEAGNHEELMALNGFYASLTRQQAQLEEDAV